VLAQVDTDDTGDRFPVAVADAPVLRDVRLEVRCKPVSGKVDQACGLVFRYRDENNYYLTRANALEDNVRLYHVVNGRPRQLAARAYRPFNSTDAAVAEKGQVEIELGPFGLVQEGSDRWLVAPSVILNWGFADRWELVLEARHFVHLGAAVAEPRLRVEDAAV